MLSLKIGSTFLDTRNADIPVVLRNPMFVSDEGKIPGSFIFNFTLPLSDDLKGELAFAHRPARKGKPQTRHPFSLRFGPLHYQGTAQITQLNEKEIEVSMPVDTGTLAELFVDQRLSDLDITEEIPWDPQITFAICNQLFEFSYNNINPTHTVLNPDFLAIDTFSSYDLVTGEWTCPEDAMYNINVVINWAFKKRTIGSNQFDAGKNPKFIILKNGLPTLYSVDIESNYFSFAAPISLQEGDVIKFIFQAESVFTWPLYWLQFYFEPGTCIVIEKGEKPFSDLPASFYPQKNFAVYPYYNPMAMGNIPDSLFRVDINDTKEYIERFSPVVNYYRDGYFPHVMHGQVNGIYYSLLNLFTPAPYLAFIIKKIFAHINYNIQNNLFESAELKQITCLTTRFINNYFPEAGTPVLKDFLPESAILDFFRDICLLLGISFRVNNVTRTIEFRFIDQILSDNSSIDYSENIAGSPRIKPETLNGFLLKCAAPDCEHIRNNFKSLEGLNIKGVISQLNQAPMSGNHVNDAYFITLWKSWFIWNYDADQGAYNWIFHSIDHCDEIKETNPEPPGETLTLEHHAKVPAMFAYKPPPESYFGDITIGAGSRNWLIPAFVANGSFTTLPKSYQTNPGYALVSYWGLCQDSNGSNYPFASNDVFDYNGNKIPSANLALRPDGVYGLYEKKWKKFIQWRLASPGEFVIQKYLSPLEINNLDWFRWHKIHGVDYLLKEIRFNIHNDHISIAEISAHRR